MIEAVRFINVSYVFMLLIEQSAHLHVRTASGHIFLTMTNKKCLNWYLVFIIAPLKMFLHAFSQYKFCIVKRKNLGGILQTKNFE